MTYLAQLLDALCTAIWMDWPGMLGIATSILALFAAGEVVGRRRNLPTEYTRKFSHVGAGAIVLSFPWLLQNTWSVAVLALAFFLVLVAGKLTGLLSSVHNVERKTSGAYYYPWAVLGNFWLAKGDPLLFCTPIAVMALADTGAALVGKREGRSRYRVMDGVRSIEGSLTFFTLALTIIVVALGLAGEPGWPEMLLVALVAATIATATEAISVRGVDNLFIPYACFLVLDRTMRLGLRDLSGWIEGILFSLVVVLLTWQRSQLTVAGAVTVFLGGTLSWALGGWQWTLPLLAFYVLAVKTIHPGSQVNGPQSNVQRRMDMDEVFPSIVGSLVVVLAFAHAAQEELYGPYIATLGANAAIAMARLAYARQWPVLPMLLGGAIVPILPAWLLAPHLPPFDLVAGVLAGVGTYGLLARIPMSGRRMVSSLMAGAVSWALLPI